MKSTVVLALVLLPGMNACKQRQDSSFAKATTDFGDAQTDLTTFRNADPGLRASLRTFMGAEAYDAAWTRIRDIDAVTDATSPFHALPEVDLVGVEAYTEDDYYRAMNHALRFQDVPELARQRAIILAAASGLNRLPKLERDVLRGTNLPDSVIAIYRQHLASGTPMIERGFVSTTAAAEVPAAFVGNALYRIHGTAGHNVAGVSRFPSEDEVLFAPGSEFTVTGVHPQASGKSGASLKLADQQLPPGLDAIFGGTDALGVEADDPGLGLADETGAEAVTVIEMRQIK